MKTFLASLVLAATLVTGSLASAQSVASLPAEDTPIVATFYDGNPAAGGEVIVDDEWHEPITVTVDDSVIGVKVSGVEDSDYLVLTVGDLDLTFETTGGDNKFTTKLVYDGVALDEAPTLAAAVSAISAALNGDAELAVFTDADGVVTGLYTYTADAMPKVYVTAASHLLVSHDGQLETFEAFAPGIRSLATVGVLDSAGERVNLGSLLS